MYCLAKDGGRIIGGDGARGGGDSDRFVEFAQVDDRIKFCGDVGWDDNGRNRWRQVLAQRTGVCAEIEFELCTMDVGCRLIDPEVNS